MKKEKTPKRKASVPADLEEILPEYDFRGALPNKYAVHYREQAPLVALDPDVAAIFRTPAEVNDALRALAGLILKHRP